MANPTFWLFWSKLPSAYLFDLEAACIYGEVLIIQGADGGHALHVGIRLLRGAAPADCLGQLRAACSCQVVKCVPLHTGCNMVPHAVHCNSGTHGQCIAALAAVVTTAGC